MKRAKKQQERENSNAAKNHVIDLYPPASNNDQEPHQARVIALAPSKVSIDEMRSIWNDEEVTYSDAELFRIRDWFYTVTEVMLQTIEQQNDHLDYQANETENATQRKTKSIPLTNRVSQSDDHEATEESHPLHPRIYRRAG